MKMIDDIRAENLARLADELGSVKNLAEQLKKSESQISQWINRSINSGTGKPRTMRSTSARAIEAACGKAPGWLDRDPHHTDEQPDATSAIPEPSNVSAGPDLRSRQVPLISWVRAGEWSHAADLLQPGEADEWIDTSVAVRPHTFALRVSGDSMEPEFAAGTILVVEPELDPHPGDYVIAKNGDDEATFKQLVRDGADLYLKPLNARYPIKPLGAARIIGVVREAVKRYR